MNEERKESSSVEDSTLTKDSVELPEDSPRRKNIPHEPPKHPDDEEPAEDIPFEDVKPEDTPRRKKAPEESPIKDTPGENVPLDSVVMRYLSRSDASDLYSGEERCSVFGVSCGDPTPSLEMEESIFDKMP